MTNPAPIPPIVERPDPAVLAVWLVSSAVILSSLPSLQPAGIGDEGFANAGYDLFKTYFLERDFGSAIWFERWQNYGSPNPRLGPMILGGLFWLFHDVLLRPPKPEPSILGVRIVVSLISAGTVAVLFDWLRREFSSSAAGLAGAVLLLAHPVFRSCQNLMLPDPIMALFAVMTLRAAARLAVSVDDRLYWADAIATGVLFGAAVSSRLYAAALVVPVAAGLLMQSPRRSARAIKASVVVAALSLGIFAGTNPLMLMSPRVALAEMTTRHVSRWADRNTSLKAGQIPYIVEIPFGALRVERYPDEPKRPPEAARLLQNPRPIWMASLALAAVGAILAGIRRRTLPILFFVTAFLLVGRVVGAMSVGWIVAKVFLLPVIGVCALQACVVGAVFRYFRRTRRSDSDALRKQAQKSET